MIVLMMLIMLTWYKDEVNPVFSYGTGLILDQNKNPHVFYYENDIDFVHSAWDGIGWQKDYLVGSSVYHNDNPSATIDDRGNFHVAFFDDYTQLSYGFYDGIWNFEVVDATAESGDHCDIELDKNYRPHIVYFNGSGGGYLRYAVKQGATWELYEYSSMSGGYYCAMELDDQDKAHISDCTSWTGGALRYLTFDRVDWNCEIVVDAPYVSGWNSIGLDDQDRPQISYYYVNSSQDSFDLRFAEKNSGTWHHHIIDHGNSYHKKGWRNEITVDSVNINHIVYNAHNDDEIKYARGFESTWTLEVVDTAVGGYDVSTSILTDGADVYITYVKQFDDNSVWFASTSPITGIVEKQEQNVELDQIYGVVNGPIFVKGKILIYDAVGRIVLRDDLRMSRTITLQKPGIFFLKTENSIQKIVVVR